MRSNGTDRSCPGLAPAIQGRGFVTTSVDNLMNWARTGSLWPMTFGLACWRRRNEHAGASRYDSTGSASFSRQSAAVRRHDRGGTLVNKMAPALRKVYDQMPSRAGSSHGVRETAAATITIPTPVVRAGPHRAGRLLCSGLSTDARRWCTAFSSSGQIRRTSTRARSA